jgi:hypothetical protein
VAAGILSGILGWMSDRSVVNLIETGDVLDVDGRSRRWIVAVDAARRRSQDSTFQCFVS